MKKFLALFLQLLITTSLFSQTLPSYLPNNGLVGWWPFNGNANDESGNGNNGTVNGAALVSDRSGNPNASYNFNGVSNSVFISNSILPYSPMSSTFSFWFNTADSDAIFMSDRAPGINYAKYQIGISDNQVSSNSYASACNTTPANSAFSYNVWTHAVVVKNRDLNKEFLYLNGALVDSTYGLCYHETNNATYFGVRGGSSIDAYYSGILDDIAIYNRALTQEEITALYTGTPVNGGGSTSNANSVPPGIPYQAVVRNANGSVAANTGVTTRFTLHQTTADGAVEFQETHSLTTNAQGLMATVLGQGTAVQNTFANINWANTTKFLQVEVDLGNGYVDIGTQQLMSVPYALYAANGPQGAQGPQGPAGADGASGPQGVQGPAGVGGFTHWVGESFGGGVVFHVFKDDQGVEHGLVVSLSDLSSGAQWGLYQTDIVNCESSWDGASNTAAIIAAGVEIGSAAQLCDAYEGGGFTDWYLPSLDEWNLMYDARYNLNKSLSVLPGGVIFELGPPKYYWSSSEYGSNRAWRFDFKYGIPSYDSVDKNSFFDIRAVRAF
jgi:hypothetical protein